MPGAHDGDFDPERETALDEVLTALELPDRRFQAELRTGGSAEVIHDGFQVSAESWLETVAQFGCRFHRAVGLADHLKAEAQRLGVDWLQGVRSKPGGIRALALSLTAPVPSSALWQFSWGPV